MVPVYVNSLEADGPKMNECVNAALRFRTGRYPIPLYCLSALFLIWGTGFLIRGYWYFILPYAVALIFLGSVLLSYRIPMLRLKKAVDNLSEDGVRDFLSFSTLFTDSAIDVRINGTSHFVEYSSLSGLVESDNLITLVIGDRSLSPISIPLDKAALSSEERLSFLLFLRRKNPKLRIKLNHKKSRFL